MNIEQRVGKLERQNRWLKRVGGVMLAAVACVVLVGQGKAKKLPDLVVKSLTVVDENGLVRIRLHTGRGIAFFRIMDGIPPDRGNPHTFTRAEFRVEKDGAVALRMRDASGMLRVYLGVDSGAALSINAAKGKARASIGAPKSGIVMRIDDETGSTVWRAPAK